MVIRAVLRRPSPTARPLAPRATIRPPDAPLSSGTLFSGVSMSNEALLFALYVFVLAGFLGYQVISKVPPLLHTPLMSGISLVGSLVAAGAHYGTLSNVLGFVAVIAATINTVGGFLITDRMLRMFRRRPTDKP